MLVGLNTNIATAFAVLSYPVSKKSYVKNIETEQTNKPTRGMVALNRRISFLPCESTRCRHGVLPPLLEELCTPEDYIR